MWQMELDPNRQIDLKVETKSGDVLVLLYVVQPSRSPQSYTEQS